VTVGVEGDFGPGVFFIDWVTCMLLRGMRLISSPRNERFCFRQSFSSGLSGVSVYYRQCRYRTPVRSLGARLMIDFNWRRGSGSANMADSLLMYEKHRSGCVHVTARSPLAQETMWILRQQHFAHLSHFSWSNSNSHLHFVPCITGRMHHGTG